MKPNDLENRTPEAIGTRIKNLMDRWHLTQLRLSQELGVTPSTVNQWTNGKYLTVDALFMLSDYFGCSIDYILAGKPYQPDPTLRELKIDDDVLVFYDCIKEKTHNDISLTDALNFLIADDMTYEGRGEFANIDARFILAWTTYLSIDSDIDTTIFVEDTALKTGYDIGYYELEQLELLKIINLLEEKKSRFKKTYIAKKRHQENVQRKSIVDAEWGLEEGSIEFLTEELLTKYQQIADPDNPLSDRYGGKL